MIQFNEINAMFFLYVKLEKIYLAYNLQVRRKQSDTDQI